jgi:hypothetical protein
LSEREADVVVPLLGGLGGVIGPATDNDFVEDGFTVSVNSVEYLGAGLPLTVTV